MEEVRRLTSARLQILLFFVMLINELWILHNFSQINVEASQIPETTFYCCKTSRLSCKYNFM